MILFVGGTVFHDTTFNTRTKNIMKLTSRDPNCQFCYLVNGVTVSIHYINFLSLFKEPLFLHTYIMA